MRMLHPPYQLTLHDRSSRAGSAMSEGTPSPDLSHLPNNVHSYLAALRDALLVALGTDEVLQLYLIGSASYALGYTPGQSDLDITVITRTRVDQATLARVPAACSHAVLPCPAEKLELVIYAYEAVHLDHPASPYDIALNYNTGRSLPRDHIRYGSNPDDSPHWFILDIAAAHAHNIPLLLGPAFSDVFTPQLRRQQVLDALLMSVHWHTQNEPTSANAVLNACRGWRWAVTGVFGSKVEGGKFALPLLAGKAARAVEAALAYRMGGIADGIASTDAGKLYGAIASALHDAGGETGSTRIADPKLEHSS